MQTKTILTFVISILIISLAGSIIFLLTTPPQSYVLFFLFFLLTAIITLTILGKRFIFKIQPKGSGTELHVFLILASITLVILQLANIYVETINAILYVIVFIFALGFSLLSILKFKPSFSRIEFVALAYPLSLALLAIIGTITLILPSNLRGISALLTITFLSIISLFATRKEKQTKVNKHHELIVKNNELVLVIILLIFVYFFMELYPEIASLLGFDISRNFLQALAFTKDTLGDFSNPSALYPLFGIYQSSIIYIVKPSVEIFQITTIFLNIFAILSFYAMASQYLKRYGDHTPAIATLIWAAFAGFGWLNFFTRKISNPDASLLSLIGQTNAFSYGDITWRRPFFHLSMEASLTLVFAVLYLLKRNDLSKTKQILLMTLLMTPLPLMHPYGTYFLLLALLCFAIISFEELKQQLKYTAYSLTIAAFASLLLNYILNIKAPAISVAFLTFSEYLLMGLAIITIASLRGKAPRKLNVIVKKILGNKHAGLLIVTFLLLLYFASLLLWFIDGLTFDFAGLNRFGYVPWFLYPVKLGLIGILAIVAIYFFGNSRYRSRELGALLASALLMIFVSRLVSTMQMQYVSEFTFNPNSWFSESIRENILSFREERMFELFKIPMAIIASIALSKHALTRITQRRARLSRYLAITGLVSLVLISGMSSTFLGFEYYHEITKTSQSSPLELDIINTLRDKIYTNGKSIIISPQTPSSYLDFTGATAIVAESPAAWASKSPELPLFVTRYSETTPTYVYLQKIRDYQKIFDYSGNYLEHLSNTAQTYLENQEVQIKTINNWSIPTPQSSTALIIPYDESTMTIPKSFYQEAYRQYTVLALFFEEKMQSMNIYQEPISYNNIEINGTATFNGVNSYIRINGTETNFDKISVEFEFQPLDLTRNQIIIGKFDWGTTPRQMSWDIAQFGRRIVFKISPDGNSEEVLSTGEILALNTRYAVRCEYDGARMKIFINNNIVISKSYQGGIFKSNIDFTIGSELYNNKLTAFANMILRYIRVLNDVPPTTEPIFYAYDFLSLAGVNYTTILSNDNARNTYETLILPYDDIITREMLTKLEASQQTIKTKHLVILNTNGYGPLLNLFGNISSETFTANEIFANRYFAIQLVDVPIIKLNNNSEVKAQYVNNSFSSPLIMTTTQNQLKLIYINIYPLIRKNQLFNQTLLQSLTETMSNYMKIFDETTISPWFTEPSLLFTKLKASGTVRVFPNSIVLIKPQENSRVRIGSETAHNILTNITSISIEGYDTIQINSTGITLEKGYGFYTTLIAYNPSIILQGNQTSYIITENNKVEGQILSIEINGYVTFLIRQPEISVNGEIQFENFYMLHPSTIYTDGRNTTLVGNLTFYIQVSDEYSIALPYKFNSPITVRYEKPLMEFSENTAFMLMVPYIILIVIFATTILLIQHSGLASTQKIRNENSKNAYRKKA